jgi:hypothetical protein
MIGDKSEGEYSSNYDKTTDNDYQIFESYDSLEDCKLNTHNRVRYFAGQLLFSEDLAHEQNYLNSKRHLINKLVNGTGVVCGLDLQIVDQRSENLVVRIASGLAIDCCGREIIVENDKDIPLKIDKSSLSKEAKRLGLILARKEFLKSPVPVNSTDTTSRAQLSESRIQESYDLILKPIEVSPVKIEFDKTSYDVEDTVRVELWDPDNLAKNVKDSKKPRGENGDTINVNISSNRGKDRAEISLHKLKKIDIYQGEISLTTVNGRSAQNKLAVADNDIIEVKYNDDTFATAFVASSSDSFILSEKRILTNYYNKRLLKWYQEQNSRTRKAFNFNNEEHGILLAILKLKGKSEKEDNRRFIIDQLETDMHREVVYNNPLLYDFFGENNRQHEGKKQSSQCAVLSGKYRITTGTIENLQNNQYLITEPINIFENNPLYSDKALEFPPIIHLGRIAYKEPESIMGFEYVDYGVLKESYSKDDDWKILANEMDLDQMESVSCKPLAITGNSFRLAIIRKSDVKLREKESNATALVLRWWAVCQFSEQ